MKQNRLFFLMSLLVFLGWTISITVACENSVKSLQHYQTPDDLENVKVIKLSSNKNSSNFLIFIKSSVPPHRHLTHSESIYVISGEGKFTLGNKTMEIVAGDFINVPEGIIHAVDVTSEEPLKVLSNQAPEFLGKDRIYVN